MHMACNEQQLAQLERSPLVRLLFRTVPLPAQKCVADESYYLTNSERKCIRYQSIRPELLRTPSVPRRWSIKDDSTAADKSMHSMSWLRHVFSAIHFRPR